MNKFIKTLVSLSLCFGLTLDAKVAVVASISKPVGTIDKDFDDSEVQFGIAVQPYLNDNIALDMRLDSSNANKMADGGKTDLERMSLNMLYDFMPKSAVSPYLFAGGGYEKLHRTYANIKSQQFLNAGVGLKADISDDVDVRAEVKYIKMSDTKDVDIIASLGLGVKFGYEDCEVVCEDDASTKETTANTTSVATVATTLKAKPVRKPILDKTKSSAFVFNDEKTPTLVKKYRAKKIKNIKYQKGKNYIQVAAMSNKSNAIKIIKKLKIKKLKVRSIKKGAITVVLVGPYTGAKLTTVYKRVKLFQKDAFYKKL